jgi:hypothetical protein
MLLQPVARIATAQHSAPSVPCEILIIFFLQMSVDRFGFVIDLYVIGALEWVVGTVTHTGGWH